MSPTAQSEVLETLPRTGLSNQRYLVRLGENLTDKATAHDPRIQKLRGAKLYQKTGAWKSTCGNTKCGVSNGRLVSVNPRDGKFENCEVVVMHHTISVHLSNSAYKQRTIWFWDNQALPVRGVALVEYVGEEPEEILPHGNSTRNADPYIRTHPSVSSVGDRVRRNCYLFD